MQQNIIFFKVYAEIMQDKIDSYLNYFILFEYFCTK